MRLSIPDEFNYGAYQQSHKHLHCTFSKKNFNANVQNAFKQNKILIRVYTKSQKNLFFYTQR